MKKLTFLILISFWGEIGFTQNEYYPNLRHNNTWIFGFGGWGNTFMTFDSNKVNLKRIHPTVLGMGDPSTTMSDVDGKLLFFTNGVKIMNHANQIMKNGNRINPGSFMDLNGFYDEGLPMSQSTIALSFPNNDSIYQLIHKDLNVISKSNQLYSFCPFYFSTINMKKNNGLGEVVKLNQLINNDSLSSEGMTACRHANGRDWWIVQKQPYKNIYNSYLVTPDTVIFDHSYKVDVDYQMKEPYGQSMFTTNGEKYISVSGPRLKTEEYFDIYNFDRCSGVLSNHKRIIFNDSSYDLVIGGAISPNLKYLYVTRNKYILQFELDAKDILSTIDTVAILDDFKSPKSGCLNSFNLAQLAPDGKIYISVGPCTTEFLSVINDPDKKGKDCDVQQHAIDLQVVNIYELPNFPNYKLGALKGSGCDTLNIVGNNDLDVSLGQKITINPNPANENIQLNNLPINIPIKIEIMNTQGYLLESKSYQTNIATLDMDISNYASGLYFVRISNNNQLITTKKLVILK